MQHICKIMTNSFQPLSSLTGLRICCYLCYVQIFTQLLCPWMCSHYNSNYSRCKPLGSAYSWKSKNKFWSILCAMCSDLLCLFGFIGKKEKKKNQRKVLSQITLNLIKNRLYVWTFKWHLFTGQQKVKYLLLGTDEL